MHGTTRIRSAFYLVLLVTSAIALVGCGSPDLTVTNVEVTQGIQTPTNTVQLVAQRSTAVRATLGIVSGTGPVAGVTGRLHVFVNGTAITPAAGVPAINEPFSAPAAPQRANETDTLNFELMAPTGITASTDVDFRVDIIVPGDPNTGNNSGQAPNLTVVSRTTPTIFYTSINYTPSGLGLPNAALIAAGAGDAFVRGLYPVNDGAPNLYRQGLFPSLTVSADENNDGQIDGCGTDCNNLLSLLASCRQLIVDAGLGASNNTFLYGWVAGNPIIGNGWSTLNGRNAFGNTEANRGQRTFAHELGHLFGRDHPATDLTLDQVGWDVGGRLANNWAGNGVTGRVRPMTLFDIMVPGKFTNQAWVDTITHNAFLGNPILASIGPGQTRGGVLMFPAIQREKATERVAVIQGIFDAKGERLLRLEPVFRFPWPSEPVVQQTGIYLAEVRDNAGNVTTVRFDARLTEDSGRQEEIRGFFEVMVPVSPNVEVASVRITDSAGRRVFGELRRSAPPEIVIVTPQPGAQLGERTEVAWEVRDPDTPQQDLQYQVAYSPDGGRNWVPIAVDVPGTERSITFNSTEIQRSQGDGLIRVFVSDGLNTAFADVAKLTTLAARYK